MKRTFCQPCTQQLPLHIKHILQPALQFFNTERPSMNFPRISLGIGSMQMKHIMDTFFMPNVIKVLYVGWSENTMLMEFDEIA